MRKKFILIFMACAATACLGQELAIVCSGTGLETVLRPDRDPAVSSSQFTRRYTLDLASRRISELTTNNQPIFSPPTEEEAWGSLGELRQIGTPQVNISPDKVLVQAGLPNHIRITHAEQVQINKTGAYLNLYWRALIDRSNGKVTYSGVGTSYFPRFLGVRFYNGTGECQVNGKSTF